MISEIGVFTVAMIVAVALTASAGWRSMVISPPFWWNLAALAYTVPSLPSAISGSQPSSLIVGVSREAITQYLAFVALTSLLLSGAWALGIRRGSSQLFSSVAQISSKRLLGILMLAYVASVLGSVLSGIDPSKLLTTVSDEGYSYATSGGAQWTVLNSLANPFILFIPALLVYSVRQSALISTRIVVGIVWFSNLGLLTLGGVRYRVIMQLASTLVAFCIASSLPQGRKTGKWGRWLIVVGSGLALYPIASWMQINRSPMGRLVGDVTESTDPVSLLNLVSPSAALFDWVSVSGHQFGISISDLLRQAAPTLIVGPKARPSFLAIIDSQNVTGAGAAVSSAAELYVNLGWILSPILCVAVGLCVARIQSTVESRATPTSVVLAVSGGPIAAQVFTRGYLWATMFLYGATLGLAWIVGRFAARPSRLVTPSTAKPFEAPSPLRQTT